MLYKVKQIRPSQSDHDYLEQQVKDSSQFAAHQEQENENGGFEEVKIYSGEPAEVEAVSSSQEKIEAQDRLDLMEKIQF